ncbi:MAG: tetratricopeptide repeat protein [Candidatus Omnitrophota bacterium]|nr:tetratricopeptide repeat protein [Candidatus Omnitrophota bacterium]
MLNSEGILLKSVKSFLVFVTFMSILILAGSFAFSQGENNKNELEEFDFANGLFSRGMYDMAVKGYQDFLKKYPRSVYTELADYRIAECYFLDGKYDEALEKLDVFLEQHPRGDLAEEAGLRKGQIYYLKGDYKSAESFFSVLAGKSGTGETEEAARYYIAGIHFKRGEYTTSRKMLEEILSGPGAGEYTAFAYMNLGDIYSEQKDYAKAAGAYAKAADVSDDKALADRAALRAGKAYYQEGDHSEAEVFYRKVIEDPADPGAFDRAALGLLSTLYRDEKYNSVIKVSPDLVSRMEGKDAVAQALFIQGSCYFRENRFSEAGKIYGEVSVKYPDSEFGKKSKLNECWALYRQGKFEKCILSVKAYTDMTKDSLDEALYVKARALADSGRKDDALAVYREIAEKFRDSGFRKEAIYETGWLYSGSDRSAEAADYYRMFVDEYPGDRRSPAILLRAAQENFKLKRYGAAKKDYADFLSNFGDSPLKENVLYQLGRTCFEEGDYDKSIEFYGKFAREFPGSEAKGSAMYWTGMAHQKKQEWDKAIKVYSTLSPDIKGEFYSRGLEAIAYCCFQKGDYGEAAEKYYALMTTDKDFKLPDGVYLWVADYYLNKDRNERSLEVLKMLLDKYPDSGANGEISYMFAENYGRLGDWNTAGGYFQEALDKQVPSPFLERSLLGLGRAYLAAGDYKKAMGYLEEALDTHTDNITGAFTRFELGNVYSKTGNFGEAAKQYMMVAILYEDEDLCPKALFQAGIAFDKAGMREKSLDVFRELKEKYPDNVLAKKANEEIRRIEGETQ